MKITILPYQAQWRSQFLEEAQRLKEVITDKELCIKHIGSTSIEGLGAKPIIDIMIGLSSLDETKSHVIALKNLGYEYYPQYEDEMPYRRFFTLSKNGSKTHHVHMVVIHSEFWERHLRFRNHLRQHEDDRESYYQLKLSLSQKDWDSENDYAEAKTNFIRRIEAKAAAKD